MKIQLHMQDWDAMSETAIRIISEEPQCIEAQKHSILKLLAYHGSYPEVSIVCSRIVLNLFYFLIGK